jgi:hypothetical protein
MVMTPLASLNDGVAAKATVTNNVAKPLVPISRLAVPLASIAAITACMRADLNDAA